MHLIADPEGPIITYGATGIDLFAVADAMGDRGWFVTRGAEPPCIHLGMLTAIHIPIVERYINDLQASVQAVRGGRQAHGHTQITYGG